MVNILSLALGRILAAVQKTQYCSAFHKTGSRVSEKLTARLESTVYSYMMLRGHKEVARLGRVVRSLF